jgi:hypothetical protein
MRLLTPLAGHRGLLGAGRLQARRPEPALQGPHLGQRLVGKLADELHADQPGAPAGMGAFQR